LQSQSQNITRTFLSSLPSLLFAHSCFLTFFSYYLVSNPDDIEQVPDEELAAFKFLYSKDDLTEYDLIDLDYLHRYPPSGPIYDIRGLRIPRLRLKKNHTAKECGVLLKWDQLHDRFNQWDMDIDSDDAPSRNKGIQFFPQAFLSVHGQAQADRPFATQQSFARKVCTEEKELLTEFIQQRDDAEENEVSNALQQDLSDAESSPAPTSPIRFDDDDDIDFLSNRPPQRRDPLPAPFITDTDADALEIPLWQGYSYTAHSASCSASAFDTMRGWNTCELAGYKAPHGDLGTKGNKNYKLATSKNNRGLPFQMIKPRFNTNKGSALRIEPTLLINMRALKKRKGTNVFQIMGRFMGSYDSDESRDIMNDSVTLFHPRVSYLV
jgi:hypothetical protein